MKPFYNVLLFILLLGHVVPTHAQNQQKIDSILLLIDKTKIDTVKARNYLELSDLTMYNDQIKTFAYIKKAEALYQGFKNYKGEARLNAQKANYYYRLGKIDSARQHLIISVNKSLLLGDTLRAAVIRHNIGILDHYQGNSDHARKIMEENIPIFEKYDDVLHLGNAYLLKGKIAITNGFFNIALEETYKALKMHEPMGDDFRIAEDLLQIGIIYQSTGENVKAIDIFNESIEHYKADENDQSMAQALNYMADSKIKLKDFDGASKDLENAMNISRALDYTSNMARVYYNEGLLEFAKGDYKTAIKNFESGFEVWKKVGSPNNEANSLFNLGRSYLQEKDYSRAIMYFDESIKIANSLKDPEILSKAYFNKSITLESQKKYKEALAYFKKNKSISDSIFNINRAKATLELKTIYETEKKEQQLELQEKEIDLLEQKAEVSNLQRILLVVALLFSLIGFYALRQKFKRNQLIREKIAAELAFKKKELTTHALHLAKKNEVLEHVKQKAKNLGLTENQPGYQQLIRTINFDQQHDRNWENFTQYFEQVHKDFSKNVKMRYPEVTKNELRFMALIKMNMSSKEIASILNISSDGIKKARQRLRKKMGLTPSDSLENTILVI